MNTVLRSASIPGSRRGLLLLAMVFFVALAPSLVGRASEDVTGDSRQPSMFAGTTAPNVARANAAPLQSGGNFEINPSVIAGGGGTSNNGNTRLDGTIGQSVLGESTGGTFSLLGGFWQASQQPRVSLTISGTISYCAAASPTGAANTTVNLSGDATGSTSTGPAPSTGNYSFTNLSNGSYVVTPTKSGAVNGISSLDAARVQQHILGPPFPQLTACQQLAGDVNQSATLTSLDAAFIQQFVVNFLPVNPANHTGEWRFSPPSRTYISITSDQTGQNYDALLLGEVNGNWTPAGPIGQSPSMIDEKLTKASVALPSTQATSSGVHIQAPASQTVSLPNAIVGTNITNFTLPVTLNANTTPFISFDLQIGFDPAVVGFQNPPVSAAGLTASGWSVLGNVSGGNVLVVSGASATPISGTGLLFNLNFVRLGAQGTSTALSWLRANFDDNPATAVAGNISIGGAPSAARVSSFEASGYDNGVHLRWQTGFEAQNLGFNIYREVAGQRTLVNQDIIAGSALMTGAATKLQAGQSYGWWDNTGENLPNAQYWIEEIDLNGIRTMHGPFGVQHVGGKPLHESQAELLSQIGRGEPTVRQMPLIYEPGRVSPLHTQALTAAAAPSLSSMPALKMTIREEGWYRVTQQELASAGFAIGRNPRNLQLYLDGTQQPILVQDEQDGRVDSIEFFATGQDKATTDAHVYWLISGDTPGSRIGVVKSEGKSDGVHSFPFTVERRDRTVYFSSLRNGEAENFFGQVVTSKPVDQILALPHLDSTSSDQAEVEVALQGVSTQATGHSVRVLVNGLQVGKVVFSDQSHKAQEFTISRELLKEGDNVVTLAAEIADGDVTLVDYIRVTYPHTYTSDQGSLRMSVASGSQTIDGFDNGTVRVFDLTDPSAPIELAGKILNQGGSYAVSIETAEQGPRTLLALTDNRVKSPASISLNEPSNLRNAKKDKADLVIITRSEFFSALEPLRVLRESQGLRVKIVDIADIYDEFSDGERTPQAVKDFLSSATTTWKRKPSFVLFAGHASLDPRNHLGFGDSDLVPTKLIDTGLMETASDDWFVDFNDDGMPELAVGRLPFRTESEAVTMVSKILAYEGSRPSSEALLVADANDGFDFEAASGQIRDMLPSSLKVNQIDRGRVDAGTAKTAVIDAINRGQKIVNYIGHGSVNLWKGNLLTNDDALALVNGRHLPLFVMMTCLNGYFQDAVLDSLSESLLKSERGGAVAVWASSGMTEPAEQAAINQELYRALFGSGASQGLSLGEAVKRAKGATGDGDVRRTWVLLGDPSMRLR